ncbi:hypothetical protein [Nonomuraea endophytica]|uniref:Uncharacterized protein n=1 Tax=Nonomuraea endophytica TaxID=714136 RepID=A0A7W8EJL9_9ACTN|nr:hypothetical protein [Nonomuraea endophytica]MBB5081656.1 hypothetical protein [Nonomuraea endophytica]
MRLRVPLLLAAVAATGLLTAQPATATTAATVPYAADSGDSCKRGSTEGSLEWVTGPVIKPTVKVTGTLSDEREFSTCAPDALYSRASFSAYHGSDKVAGGQVKADDATVPVALTLADASGVRTIDRVVVQVCRYSNSPVGISYCGPAKEYKAP